MSNLSKFDKYKHSVGEEPSSNLSKFDKYKFNSDGTPFVKTTVKKPIKKVVAPKAITSKNKPKSLLEKAGDFYNKNINISDEEANKRVKTNAKKWLDKRNEWEKKHPFISELQKATDIRYQPERVKWENALKNGGNYGKKPLEAIKNDLEVVKDQSKSIPRVAGTAASFLPVGLTLKGASLAAKTANTAKDAIGLAGLAKKANDVKKVADVAKVTKATKALDGIKKTGALATEGALWGVGDRKLAEIQEVDPDWSYKDAAIGGAVGGPVLGLAFKGLGKAANMASKTKTARKMNYAINHAIKNNNWLKSADATFNNALGRESKIPSVREEQLIQQQNNAGYTPTTNTLTPEEIEALNVINKFSKEQKTQFNDVINGNVYNAPTENLEQLAPTPVDNRNEIINELFQEQLPEAPVLPETPVNGEVYNPNMVDVPEESLFDLYDQQQALNNLAPEVQNIPVDNIPPEAPVTPLEGDISENVINDIPLEQTPIPEAPIASNEVPVIPTEAPISNIKKRAKNIAETGEDLPIQETPVPEVTEAPVSKLKQRAIKNTSEKEVKKAPKQNKIVKKETVKKEEIKEAPKQTLREKAENKVYKDRKTTSIIEPRKSYGENYYATEGDKIKKLPSGKAEGSENNRLTSGKEEDIYKNVEKDNSVSSDSKYNLKSYSKKTTNRLKAKYDVVQKDGKYIVTWKNSGKPVAPASRKKLVKELDDEFSNRHGHETGYKEEYVNDYEDIINENSQYEEGRGIRENNQEDISVYKDIDKDVVDFIESYNNPVTKKDILLRNKLKGMSEQERLSFIQELQKYDENVSYKSSRKSIGDSMEEPEPISFKALEYAKNNKIKIAQKNPLKVKAREKAEAKKANKNIEEINDYNSTKDIADMDKSWTDISGRNVRNSEEYKSFKKQQKEAKKEFGEADLAYKNSAKSLDSKVREAGATRKLKANKTYSEMKRHEDSIKARTSGGIKSVKANLEHSSNPQEVYEMYLDEIANGDISANVDKSRKMANDLTRIARDYNDNPKHSNKIEIKDVEDYKIKKQEKTRSLYARLKEILKGDKGESKTVVEAARKFIDENKKFINFKYQSSQTILGQNGTSTEKGIDVLREYAKMSEEEGVKLINDLTSSDFKTMLSTMMRIKGEKNPLFKLKNGITFNEPAIRKEAMKIAREVYASKRNLIRNNYRDFDALISSSKDKDGKIQIHNFDNSTEAIDKVSDDFYKLDREMQTKLKNYEWKNNPWNIEAEEMRIKKLAQENIASSNPEANSTTSYAKREFNSFNNAHKNELIVMNGIKKRKYEEQLNRKYKNLSYEEKQKAIESAPKHTELPVEEQIKLLEEGGVINDKNLAVYREYVDKLNALKKEKEYNKNLIKKTSAKEEKLNQQAKEDFNKKPTKDIDDLIDEYGGVNEEKLKVSLDYYKDKDPEVYNNLRNTFKKATRRYDRNAITEGYKQEIKSASDYLSNGSNGEALKGKTYTIKELGEYNENFKELDNIGFGDKKVSFEDLGNSKGGYINIETGDITYNTRHADVEHEVAHLRQLQTTEGKATLIKQAKMAIRVDNLIAENNSTFRKLNILSKNTKVDVDNKKLFKILKENNFSEKEINVIKEYKKLKDSIYNMETEIEARNAKGEVYGRNTQEATKWGKDNSNMGLDQEHSGIKELRKGSKLRENQKIVYSDTGKWYEDTVGTDWNSLDDNVKKVYDLVKKVSLDTENKLIDSGLLDAERAMNRRLMTSKGERVSIYIPSGVENDIKSIDIFKDFAESYKNKIGDFGVKSSDKQSTNLYNIASLFAKKAQTNWVVDTANFLEKSKLAKPIVDGKVLPGYKEINQDLLKHGLLGKKSVEWYETMRGGEEAIKKAYRDNPEVANAWIDIVKKANNGKGDYQIPEPIYRQLFTGKGETPAEFAMRYAAGGKDAKESLAQWAKKTLKYTEAYNDFYLNLFKRDVLSTPKFFYHNRGGNALMAAMTNNPIELVKAMFDYGKLKNEELPPEIIDNTITEMLNDMSVRRKYTGDNVTDNFFNLFGGHSLSTEAAQEMYNRTKISDNPLKAAAQIAKVKPSQIKDGYIYSENPNKLTKGQKVVVAGANALARWNKVVNAISNGIMKVNQKFETAERKVLYMKELNSVRKDLMKKTGQKMVTHIEALKYVQNNPKLERTLINSLFDTLGDYNNFSPVERSIIKQIVPFYSWNRTIARHLYKNVQKDPVRYTLLFLEYNRMKERNKDQLKEYQRGIIPLKMWDKKTGNRLGLNFVNSSSNPYKIEGFGLHPLLGYLGQTLKGKKKYGMVNSRKYLETSKMNRDNSSKIFIDKENNEYESLPKSTRANMVLVNMIRHALFTNNSFINVEKILTAANNYIKTGEVKVPEKVYDDSFGGFYNEELFNVAKKKNGKYKANTRYAYNTGDERTSFLNWQFGSDIQQIRPLSNYDKKQLKEEKEKEKNSILGKLKAKLKDR